MPDGLPGQPGEVGGGASSADLVPVVGLAESVLAGFSQEQIRQLHEAHVSRGRAFRDGTITDPEVKRFISESDWRLSKLKGHPWLKKRRLFGIPRIVETDVPWPLFPPRARGVLGDATFVVVGVLDTAAYLPILCSPTDPLGEFTRPVPMTETLDAEQALGLAGYRYTTLTYHRRFDPLLMDTVENVGGSTRYRTRAFLKWIEARALAPVVSF